MTRKYRLVAVAAALTVAAGLLSPAHAGHNEDEHTDNFKQLAVAKIKMDEDFFAEGSDLAFKDDLVIAGSFQGYGIFKILKSKPYIKQLSFLPCAGGQGDVSVMGNYVIVSVDAPLMGETCDPEDTVAANAATVAAGGHWEGIRILDISNPSRPKYVTSVYTPCGSHTNTLLPGKKKSHVYIHSYPISGQGVHCNYASHRKVQIVEIPNDNPKKAKLLDETIDVSPNIGCHDITTMPEKKLMFGACISQSFVWDISDPTKPERLATITNPRMQIHHSTAMTWDGRILILGDETGGAAAGGGWGRSDSFVGSAWFYDVSDPSNPVLLGNHSYPRTPPFTRGVITGNRARWTNHNFNVIPVKEKDRYLLVVSYYFGGISVVDFTDPSKPKELGYYIDVQEETGDTPDTWGSYWYNGRIYTNGYLTREGVGVYEFDGTTSTKTTRFFGRGPLNSQGEMNPQVQIWSWR
jgi:hypothetical protein